MLSAWAISVASAADHRVGPGRPFAEVQDAVDAAKGGDRILVDAGSYGPVRVGVDVEIVGLGGVVLTGATAVEPSASVVLRGLALDGGGVGRALEVTGAVVVGEDLAVRDGRTTDRGGCVFVDGGSATLRRTVVSDCVADLGGGGIYASWGSLTLEAVTVTASSAPAGFGGGVAVEDGALIARGCRLEGNVADDPLGDPDEYGLGGALFTGRATIDVVGCSFAGNEARSIDPEAGRGGAIRLWLTTAVIGGSRFEENVADEYGSAIAAASSTLLLSGSEVVGNVVDELATDGAIYGGAVHCDDLSSCTVDRSWFEANTAGDGGAICATGELTVTTSMFCANVATSDGGAIDVGNGVGPVVLAGNVLALNAASAEGGALVAGLARQAVHNNHLVGNSAPAGGAIATAFEPDDDADIALELLGNLVAENVADGGPVLDVAAIVSLEDYDWMFRNSPTSASFALGPSTGLGDPGLAGPAASCVVADLLLAADSPLRDAGPTEDGFLDADGTRNDIGAFGGASGDAGAFADLDGDGAPAMVDCADDDGQVQLDAVELCNGVDDDCDGLVDADDAAADAGWMFLDADGDGVGSDGDAAWRCPGTAGWSPAFDDCNDADAAVVGAVTWFVDGDGDGLGEPTSAESGCTPPDGVVFVGGDCDDANPALGVDCEPPSDDPAEGGGDTVEPPEPDFGCGCGSRGTGPAGLAWVFAAVMSTRRGRARA